MNYSDFSVVAIMLLIGILLSVTAVGCMWDHLERSHNERVQEMIRRADQRLPLEFREWLECNICTYIMKLIFILCLGVLVYAVLTTVLC